MQSNLLGLNDWLCTAEISIVRKDKDLKYVLLSLNANLKLGVKASQFFEPSNSFLISYHSLLSSGCLLKADGVGCQLNISAIRSISHNHLPCLLPPLCYWKSGQS